MDSVEPITQAGNAFSTSEPTSGCVVEKNIGNQLFSQSKSDECDGRNVIQGNVVESGETDDDKPRRVSDDTSSTVKKESTGCSSDEKAKSLKLTRGDQRVKCRYTEVTLV